MCTPIVPHERRKRRGDGFFFLFVSEQSVKQPRGKSISSANPIPDVQFANRREERLAVDPGRGAPTVPVGGMHFAQGRGDNFYLGMFFSDLVDHSEEGAGIEFGFGGNVRPRKP